MLRRGFPTKSSPLPYVASCCPREVSKQLKNVCLTICLITCDERTSALPLGWSSFPLGISKRGRKVAYLPSVKLIGNCLARHLLWCTEHDLVGCRTCAMVHRTCLFSRMLHVLWELLGPQTMQHAV